MWKSKNEEKFFILLLFQRGVQQLGNFLKLKKSNNFL